MLVFQDQDSFVSGKEVIKMPSLLVEQYNQKDTLPRDLYLHGLLNNEQLRIKKK